MRLLLIRHGQTPANARGELDTAAPGPGLTELGQAQAAAIPDALASERIDAIYVSQLIRTQQTAAPLARSHGRLHSIVLPGIHEIEAGRLEGRSDKRAVRSYLRITRAWSHGELGMRMPGAGDGHEFAARFDADIARVVEEQGPDATVALFSHGAAIRVWATARAGNVTSEFPGRLSLDNTGAVTMEGSPDAGWAIADWHNEPLGGAALDDVGADDVTGEADPTVE